MKLSKFGEKIILYTLMFGGVIFLLYFFAITDLELGSFKIKRDVKLERETDERLDLPKVNIDTLLIDPPRANSNTPNLKESETARETSTLRNKTIRPDDGSDLNSDLKIIVNTSGGRNYLVEQALDDIITDVDYTGKISIKTSENESSPGQRSASLRLRITVNQKNIIFPTMYGRGDTDDDAVLHAIEMNETIIKSKLNQQ